MTTDPKLNDLHDAERKFRSAQAELKQAKCIDPAVRAEVEKRIAKHRAKVAECRAALKAAGGQMGLL